MSLQDPVLLQEFLTESEELLQGMDQDLVRLETTPENTELLNRVFRALHTIKGTSGFFHLEPITQVAHRAEDVLSGLRGGKISFTRRVMDVLLATRDQLSTMVADLRAGGLKHYSLEPLLLELDQVQLAANRPAATAPNSARAAEGVIPQGPIAGVPATPKPMGAKTEMAEKNAPAVTAQSMRVDVGKLDELVNLVGELVLERNRLLQLSRDISTGRCDARGSDSPLSHSAARLSFITEELQAAGLRTRMVPLETVFARFPRLVRDTARSLGKEVELVIEGAETEIDKTMVELISDPLLHLVRNALDHGLELPEIRERAGKPRHGTLRLEARQEGDHILITIADDGGGIDPVLILRKAVDKGLVTAERAASLSRREILDFIFLPGFSTVENATNLSGRGVGMDVVRSNLKKINGVVELDSRPRQGTTVSLQLPLTLAVLPVLRVQVADEVYALPLRSIVETSRFFACDVHRVEGTEVICLRDETLPLIRLQTLFSAPAAKQAPREQKIVIMTVGDTRVALLVDGLVGQESTVVKPLASYLNDCPGVAGATVDADGNVRLVLDPAGVVALAAAWAPQEVAL